MSVTDDLTSLYNSRYLNLVLRRESKRASRSGRPLSLVEAARVIRGCARETDVVGRFGGDEFAVVLPDTAASAEELVKAADAAMYRVKDKGKPGVLLALESVI